MFRILLMTGTAKVAYFSNGVCCLSAIKIYSGGLGFLSGSHMRSAYMNCDRTLIGIGILLEVWLLRPGP